MNRDQTINYQFDDLVQKVNNTTTQGYQYFTINSLKHSEKSNYKIAISDKKKHQKNTLTTSFIIHYTHFINYYIHVHTLQSMCVCLYIYCILFYNLNKKIELVYKTHYCLIYCYV